MEVIGFEPTKPKQPGYSRSQFTVIGALPWSDRWDSNPRPARWQRAALTRLSYYRMEQVGGFELSTYWVEASRATVKHYIRMYSECT